MRQKRSETRINMCTYIYIYMFVYIYVVEKSSVRLETNSICIDTQVSVWLLCVSGAIIAGACPINHLYS